MASLAAYLPDSRPRERLFFLVMALAIAAAVVGGFGIRVVLGITSFAGSAWYVHVHAVSFMVWTGFYVWQNVLVVQGKVAQHRALGRVGAVAALWLCFVGGALSYNLVRTGKVARFFEPAYFLAQNWLYVVFFAGLFYAAIHLRQRSDWHRRLMLCAMLVVATPALGRWILLLAPPVSGSKHLLALAPFFVSALLFDQVNRGRVHPAYWWGGGAIVVSKLLTYALSLFPPWIAFVALIGP